jgi:hypothetical protein
MENVNLNRIERRKNHITKDISNENFKTVTIIIPDPIHIHA